LRREYETISGPKRWHRGPEGGTVDLPRMAKRPAGWKKVPRWTSEAFVPDGIAPLPPKWFALHPRQTPPANAQGVKWFAQVIARDVLNLSQKFGPESEFAKLPRAFANWKNDITH